jgi:phosphatidylglycerophosphate synthase
MKKIEPLRELNTIVQKPNYKKVGNWMARHITRDMALPISWLLLHTSISANAVTFIAFLFAVAACILFSFGTKEAILLGAVLLQLWYLFDHVDGHIARYHKNPTISGVFFDYLTHHLIHLGIFIGIGWAAYESLGRTLYIFLGVMTAVHIVLLNLLYDCQYKAFFHWLEKYGAGFCLEKGKPQAPLAAKAAASFPKKVFSLMHRLCEIHVVMNVVTGLAILQFFTSGFTWHYFLIIYVVIAAIVAHCRLAYFIFKRVPEAEYKRFLNFLIEHKGHKL